MKKREAIKIIIFISLLTVPTIVWGVRSAALGRDRMAEEYSAVETRENRRLAEFPASFNTDTYTAELEEYYNDHAPFRAGIIDRAQVINNDLEKGYLNGIQPVMISAFYGGKGATEVLDVPDIATMNSADASVTEKADAAGETQGKIDAPKDDKAHDYVETERTEPTCEEEGYILYECSDCGDTYKEPIPALGHTEELVDETESSLTSYGRKHYICSVCGKHIWKDFEAKQVDTSYFPLNILNGYAVVGRSDWLFYRGDASLEYYTGSNVMSEAEMKQHLNSLEELDRICEQKGKKFVFALFPNKEIVYSEYMPTMDIVTERRRNDVFYDYVKANSDIDMVYPLKELKDAKMYYDTYYPYDSHWTEYGAFVATMQIYDKLGLETVDISQVQISKDSPMQSAYGLVITAGLPLEEYVKGDSLKVDYKEDIPLISEEGTKDYLYGYSDVYRSTADTGNPEHLVFIGDSFIEWIIPLMQKDYDKVCFSHRDYIDDIAADIKDADVIVVSSVERFDKAIYEKIPKIIRILSED